MSAVNEAIVREYFESLGYLAIQPCKYVVPGRRKRAEEEIDLIVWNPLVQAQAVPEHMLWTTADLDGIARAVVAIYGWHTEHFSISRFEKTPEILHFAGEKSMEHAAGILGTRDVAKILCIPRLPAEGESRNKTLKALKDKGIDGVVSFRTMLLHLVAKADTNRNYEKSDILQMIRILKTYDFLKDSQMELFGKARRKRKPKAVEPSAL